MRKSKTDYYLSIADAVSRRSTCIRRQYGAVIVKDDEIISTGYNGAPRGRRNCIDCGECERERLKVPHGERYELCRSVHAEANAIISAPRREMIGATMYLSGRETGEALEHAECCEMCKRFIINAGIARVVTADGETSVRDWIYEG